MESQLRLQRYRSQNKQLIHFYGLCMIIVALRLFHIYDGHGAKTFLKWIKSSAWKIILPLELAQVLLSVSVYTSIASSSKRGYYEHKSLLDVPVYFGRTSLKDARADQRSDGWDSAKRSKTHGSVGRTDDAYLLLILPYGACGNEIRSPYIGLPYSKVFKISLTRLGVYLFFLALGFERK